MPSVGAKLICLAIDSYAGSPLADFIYLSWIAKEWIRYLEGGIKNEAEYKIIMRSTKWRGRRNVINIGIGGEK